MSGLGINTADYDIIVGLVEQTPCSPIAGCSNTVDTVWVETEYDTVLAHEIGHIYGLEDEYCSNDAGSVDCRCNDADQGGCGDTGGDGAASGDVNFLCDECTETDPCNCPPDGSDDCTGSPCCNFTYGGYDYDCSTMNYGVCCLGNKNTSGGRAIMSFADVEVISPGTRDYDVHSKAHFAGEPDLNCHSPEGKLSGRIIDVQLWIYADGKVEAERIIVGYGRPTRYYQEGGPYQLVALSREGEPVWDQTFDVRFDYNGPVYLDADYSVKYERFPFHYRIPYTQDMYELVLQLDREVIFSEKLDFCNGNEECDANETYLSCPRDCPAGKRDGVCIPRDEGVCDPDCAEGVDPDCEGECGNGVCNENEDYGSCPRDCPSGGADRTCDEERDGRCDPDCGGEKDPDCISQCGDGECGTCFDPDDPYACENFSNCPRDCPSGGKDNYCDGQEDGVCDPDCGEREDTDC